MKILANNDLVFELNETKKEVICFDIHADEFESDMKRRLEWIIMQKYEQCFKRLKSEWDAKLAERGVEMIPTDPDKYAELVFRQPDYQCRKTRTQNN